MRKEQVKKNPRDASITTKQDNNTPKSLELSEGQLEIHFRRLNLAHTRRIYKEVAVRAEKESWSYRDFLALLLAEEVARRKQTRLQRCTRSAHFPFFKTIDEFDFTLQSTLRESVIGSYLGLDFVTEGRSLILHGKTGRGKTHLAVAIGYRAIQNGFEALFTTAAELIEDLSNASKRGNLQESLTAYTHAHVLVIDEVGYLTYGPEAANVLFHVVNDRHLRKRPMIFTTNKPLNEWGKVLHDEDMAAAILDRVLERGRSIHLDGPSGRTRHLNLEETLQENTKRLRISGIGGSELPEPTLTIHLCHSPPVSGQNRDRESTVCNLFGGCVPDRHRLVEVGIICQMTADRGVVAKYFILHNRLPAPHCVEEIGLVIRDRIVTRWRGERLCFFLRAEREWRGKRIFFVPFFQVFLAQFRRPAVDRVALRLRPRVLRSKCQRRVFDRHRSLGPVKRQKAAGIIVQVAAKDHAEAGVLVEGFDQVREIAAVFPAEKPASGLGALRDRVRSGDEMDARNQVNKEVTRQAFAIICKAAPAEESNGVKGTFGRTIQKSIPINRLFAGVRGNRVDPSAARAVAVRIRLDHANVAKLPRVEDFLGFCVEDTANSLAANLQDAICLLHCVYHGKSIFHGVRHRFFAIDVFSCGTGIHNHPAMLVVHCCDNDGVNILAVQNSSVVTRGRDVLLDRFSRCVVARVV